MHRFHSKSVIRRLRFAAFLLCLRYVLPVATVILLAISLLKNDHHMINVALSMGAVTIFSIIVQCIVATRALCPLCMTPVLASKGCSKHRNAKTLLGSHRFRVAVAVLFKGSFTCPYCHESSVLEVRPRHGMNYGSNSRS
ncbi:MAG: hypothetical protein ABIS50_17310 [Luteolibacter sp.]|uniref:hypothetical protein n=1 Tax=Luteolibacter sp. TaxID=1962973 RepID=UPI0032655E10